MNTLKRGFHLIGEDINRNLPGVLSGVAVVGVLAEAFIMYKKAPKIKLKIEKVIEEYKEVKDESFREKAAVVTDAAITLAPDILPPIIIMGMTIGCIIGSHKVSARRLAMVSSALALSNDKLTAKIQELDDYKKATKELVTTKKADEISEKVAAKKFSEVDINDPTLFDDSNLDYDSIFMEENSGTTWRDNYLHVLKCVQKAYDIVHNNRETIRLDEFIGILNDDRFGANMIKNHRTNNVWEYRAEDYSDMKCHDMDEFMYIQPSGFTPQGVRTFIVKSNPTLSENLFVGQKFDDATCGDGIWPSAVTYA